MTDHEKKGEKNTFWRRGRKKGKKNKRWGGDKKP